MYLGPGQGKPRHAAVVSPVIDDNDDDGGASGRFDTASHSSNNRAVAQNSMNDSSPGEFRFQLQPKSAALEPSAGGSYFKINLGQIFGRGGASNQELDEGRDDSASNSVVLGQKQQWRKSRQQRQRQPQKVSSVWRDDEDADELESGPSLSSMSGNEVGERFHPTSDGRQTSARESYSMDSSRNSARSTSRSADFSDASTCSSSSRGPEKQRYVITRQRKAAYTAKINLPGQKPLYLGRYKSEQAAQAACESAFSTITTPRGAKQES